MSNFYCRKHGSWHTMETVCEFCKAERSAKVGEVKKLLGDATPEEWDAANHSVRQQPAPRASTAPAVWGLVQKDMIDRDSFGKEKYGVRLQPNNGRDFLSDAYQEALDLAVYLRGALYERDGK